MSKPRFEQSMESLDLIAYVGSDEIGRLSHSDQLTEGVIKAWRQDMTNKASRMNVIHPHPDVDTTPETFFAMLLENYSDAQHVMVGMIDSEGQYRHFQTNMPNQTSAFIKHCINVEVTEAIERTR